MDESYFFLLEGFHTVGDAWQGDTMTPGWFCKGKLFSPENEWVENEVLDNM
jgi:hypothetical protein